MLSVNIICAVHILLELDKVRDDGKKPVRGLAPQEFGINDKLRRSVLNRVLRTLLRAKYVGVSASKKYTAQRDAGQITLMELVRLFHGGVCIGEAYDHYLALGPEYLTTPEYRSLVKCEARLAEELTLRLQTIRLRDFRADSPEYCIVKPSPSVPAAVGQYQRWRYLRSAPGVWQENHCE